MVNGNFDDALVALKKAEELDPNDPVITGNIALCYFNERDKANVTRYYERVALIGDETAKKLRRRDIGGIKGWR